MFAMAFLLLYSWDDHLPIATKPPRFATRRCIDDDTDAAPAGEVIALPRDPKFNQSFGGLEEKGGTRLLGCPSASSTAVFLHIWKVGSSFRSHSDSMLPNSGLILRCIFNIF